MTISGAVTGSSAALNLAAAGTSNGNFISLTSALTGLTGTVNVNTSGYSKLSLGATDSSTSQTINVGTSSSSTATVYTTSGFGSGVTINLYGGGNSENLGALRMDSGTDAGAVNIKSTGVTIGANSGTSYISGLITDNGNGFTKVGAGTVALDYAGNNALTGAVNISNGILLDYAPSTSSPYYNELGTGQINIGTTTTGATLQFANFDPKTLANTISIGGSGTDVIQTTQYNPQISGPIILSNNLTLASGGTGSTSLQINGGISGTGNVTASITAGTGYNTTSNVQIGSGGIDNLGRLTYNAAAVNGTPAALNTGTNVISGVIGSNVSGFTISLPSAVSIVSVSGANLYTSYTNISSGTLLVGANGTASAGPLGNGSPVYLANASSAALNINNYNVSIGSLTGGGTGGGNINLGSGTLSIGTNNTSPAGYLGAISGTGSLVKVGTGTLLISGLNTYSGVTNVSSGTLAISGTAPLGNTAITVGPGATLLAKGTTNIGNTTTPLTVTGGATNTTQGTLSLADGIIGALNTSGGVVFGTGSNGAILDLDLGSTSGSSDELKTTGSVATNGITTINLAATSLPTGTTSTYTLIHTGAASFTPGSVNASTGFMIGTHPGGFYTYTLTDADSQDLQLSISGAATPGTAYWTGAASATGGDTANNWGYGTNLATLQSNWSSDPAGQTDTLQVPGSNTNVIFTASSVTATALGTQLDAPYTINSLLFDTSSAPSVTSVGINTNGYTITLGTTSGTGGLTMNSSDTSPTTITGPGTGVLLGSSQTWANNSALPLNISTGIAGTAANGSTYQLSLNGAGTGTTILNGVISDGTVGGKVSLYFSATGITQLNSANNFSGGSIIASGTVQVGNNAAFGTGLVTLISPGVIDVESFNPTLYGLNDAGLTGGTIGSASNNSNNTLTIIQPAGTTNIFSGTLANNVINGSGSKLNLLFNGTGTQVLSGSNTYTGLTTVNQGTVTVTGNESAATGSWMIGTSDNVTESPVVNFNASSQIVVASGNTIQIGDSISTGEHNTPTLNVAGTVINNGSLVSARVNSGSNGLLINSGGNWTQNGAMTVAPVLGSGYAAYLTVNANGLFTYDGSTPITIGATGNSTNGIGVITITGGTFNTSQGFSNGGGASNGTSSIALSNGGTLGLLANIPALTTATTLADLKLYVGNVNGGIINTNGFNTSINAMISNASTAGVLTKTGAGSLALNGANNYSGGTNVFGGTVLAGISSVGGTSGAMGTYEVQLGANNGSNSASVLTNGPYTISNPISAGYNNGGNTTGTLTIGGNTSDSSSFSGSFIYLDGPALTIASQATGGNALTIGETVYVNGSGNQTLTFTGSGNTNVSGGIYNFSIVATGSVVTTGTGNITFSGSNSYTGGTNVSSGTLNFAAPYALPTFTGLTIGSNALAVAQVNTGTKNTLFVSGLSIAGTTDNWTGKLDLANNDMVVRGGSLTTINNQAAYGFNGGTWNNADGIVSSAAAADSTHLTALGVIQNDNGTGSGTALYNTFDGQPVVDSDILVKYTYYGDTDLNGEVDGSDYSRIDYAYENNQNSSNTQLTGWFNGDFNYDGVIDGSDYTLLDNAFNSQGAIISAEIASPTAQIAGGLGASAVPEPTALSLLGIGAVGLLSRRRRQRGAR